MERHRTMACILLAGLCLTSNDHPVGAEELDRPITLRRPVALASSLDGHWAFTANRDSGTVSILDLESSNLAREIEVGRTLSDIAALDDQHLLVLDSVNHELVILHGSDRDWTIHFRLTVPQYPVAISVDHVNHRCFVTSLWSRTISCVEFDSSITGVEAKLSNELRLPFEPQKSLLLSKENTLIVAAAYSGRLAIIDSSSLELVAIKTIRGHNIRGLATSQDAQTLFVAHQELNSLAHSSRDDVHWGNMITNLISEYPVEHIRTSQDGLLGDAKVHFLGEPGNAASDPGAIAMTATEFAIVLGGVNEVAIGRTGTIENLLRLPVGNRPSDVIAATNGRWVVSDMFSDSVSIIDANADAAPSVTRVPLGETRELNLAERGETLFFDGRISHDGWMSCHSCHTDGHSSDTLNDNLSDGSYGTPKRVLSLLGVADTHPWAWNGKMESLEQQLASTIKNTMQGEPIGESKASAIVAYLKTLQPPPTLLAETPPPGDPTTGEALFSELGCAKCHAPASFTSNGLYDVALRDEEGNSRFNPPSLRGVGRRSALFHDNRANSLRDVFVSHQHQLPRTLADDELASLLAFLLTI